MKKIVILLAILFICGKINAQAKLGITIDSFQTVVALADTNARSYNFYIHNHGDSTFSGTVALSYKVDTGLYAASNQSQGIYYASQTLNIPAGDSVLQQMAVHYNLPVWQVVGSSAVVIWPISASAATSDSASYTVIITPTAQVGDVNNYRAKIYEQGGSLFVKYAGNIPLKYVRIFDLNGRMVKKQPGNEMPISLNDLSFGSYLLQILYEDDAQEAFKFVNIDLR